MEGHGVVITTDRYDELVADQKFLGCLRAAGVDNWDGYSYAQELLREQEASDG